MGKGERSEKKEQEKRERKERKKRERNQYLLGNEKESRKQLNHTHKTYSYRKEFIILLILNNIHHTPELVFQDK